MKILLPGLMVAVLASVGCLPRTYTRPPDEPGPQLAYRSEAAMPVVTADGINDKTAWDRAKALKAELERETGSKD